MSRRRPEIVGLGGGAIAASWAPEVLLPSASAGADASFGDRDVPAAAQALQQLLAAAPRKGPLHVLAGTDVCRHWTVVVPAGIASLAELRAVARAQCQRLFGGAEGDWRVVGDWRADRPFACAALPERLLAALSAACDTAGLRLQVESALLHAVRSLERWLPREGWSAWETPASLVLLHRRDGRVEWLETSCRAADASPATLVAAAAARLRRHALRFGAPAPRTLTWLGTAPGPAPVEGLELVLVPPAERAGLPAWQRGAQSVSEAGWALAVGG